METYQDAIQFVVVGIGININMTEEGLAEHLRSVAQPATSLQVSLGRGISREALLAALMEKLEVWYTRSSLKGRRPADEMGGALADAGPPHSPSNA